MQKDSNTVYFRFYEELNDFLPLDKRKIEFAFDFKGNLNVKDAIETIGVPHTEIDVILVNGNSVEFSYQLKSGDHVSIYPVFESFDISSVTKLRPVPLRDPKFILDVHLGKLAKYLRLFGFDALFETTYQDDQIINIAAQEHRNILTRDKGLLKNSLVTHGYWVRKTNPKDQLKEIIQRFDLANKIFPFTRCLECNNKLLKIAKEEITQALPEKTQFYYNLFYTCPRCNRIYWEGSHYQKMKKFIQEIISVGDN